MGERKNATSQPRVEATRKDPAGGKTRGRNDEGRTRDGRGQGA